MRRVSQSTRWPSVVLLGGLLVVAGLLLVPVVLAQDEADEATDEATEAVEPTDAPDPDADEDLTAADADVIDATTAVTPDDQPADAATTVTEAPEPAEPVADEAPAPPDLGPRQVVLYGDGTALIRRRETIKLNAGETTFRLTDVAPRLRPDTVLLRPVGRGTSFRLLSQSSTAAAQSAQALLQAAVGQQVRLRDGNYTAEGTLVSVEDDGVVLANDREIHVYPTGRLILPRGDRLPELLPQLAWTLDSADAGEAEAEVSYVADGFFWSSDYALTVADRGRAVSFQGWVQVVNDSGAAQTDAGLMFTAATPLTSDPNLGAALPDGRPDATVYYLPRPVNLPLGRTMRFAMVDTALTRSAVQVRVTLTPDGLDGPNRVATLTNTAGAGLGLPLPPGPVRVYVADEVGRLRVVGEQRLAETGLGARVNLELGPVDTLRTTLRTEPVVEAAQPTVRRVLRLRNLSTEEVRVQVVEQRPDTFRIGPATVAFDEATAAAPRRATAEVVVPGNRVIEVRYQVRLGAGETV